MQSDTVSTSSSTGNNTSEYYLSPKLSAFSRFCSRLSPSKASSSKRSLIDSSTAAAITKPLQRRVFDYLDENGDGKVSPAELQHCVRALGGELSDDEAEAAVSSSDTDGDGLMGFEDFENLMEGSGSEDDKKDELRLAFAMYEKEPGSGCITPSSLKRMLSQLGESSSIQDCKAMIRTFDLNGDGVLSFQEFAAMMR